MPTEIEETPRSVAARFRDWVGDLFSYIEVSAAKVFSMSIASVANRQMTEFSEKSGQALNDGLAKAIQAHRAAKSLVSEADQDEMDLFEVFKGAALAQTRLMGEAIAQGISPQAIDKAALERPTRSSLPSQTESPNGESREVNEAKQPPQPQSGRVEGKKKPGRPPKDAPRNGPPQVAKEEASQAKQQPEQTPKRGPGRPRKNAGA